jgi:hypothetical protein
MCCLISFLLQMLDFIALVEGNNLNLITKLQVINHTN